MRALRFPANGAILAAATTSLPQSLGGVRNWDYRYCWLRDAAISARALVGLGSHAEAEALLRWIGERARSEGGNLARLRPVYTVDGEDIAGEAAIDELPGYAGSRPVRVGNGAYRFLQLDVFGVIAELIAALADLRPPASGELALLEQLVEVVARRWHEPDHGIWEIRLPPRHHVHSKVMCWLTVDRALRVNRRHGLPEPQSWLSLRERIAANVLTRGWDAGLGAFIMAYGEPALDASALWVGLSGMVGDDDSRFRSTVRAIAKQLRKGPTVMPYLRPDNLPGRQVGFHLCTSWLVDALARTGRLAEARELFDAMLTCLGPTGLLPEGFDPETERGTGNHPQAFSHADLVLAALALDRYR